MASRSRTSRRYTLYSLLIMAAPTTSYDVFSGHKTTLNVPITDTQTAGIQFSAMTINGTATAWTQSSGVVEIKEKVGNIEKSELMSFNGISTSNNIVTLTTAGVGRGLPLATSGSGAFTASGTGQAFSKNAEVRLIVWHELLNQKADTDRANAFDAGVTQTFNGLMSPSTVTFTTDGDEFFTLPSLTTAERDALSAVNGMMVFNETTGVMNQYISGAWTTFATGTTADASETVGGKVEIATIAEIAAQTSSGGSGADLVIPADVAVQESGDSPAAGNVAAMNASGVLDSSIGGTGAASLTAKAVVIAQGASAMTVVAPGASGNALVSDGTDWSSGTPSASVEKIGGVTAASSGVGASDTTENTMAPTWTGASSVSALVAGDVVLVRVGGTYRLDSGGLDIRLKIGGTQVARFQASTATNAERAWSMDAWINIRTVGGSGTNYCSGNLIFGIADVSTALADGSAIGAGEVTFDNSGTEAITLTAQFSASDAQHDAIIETGSIIHQNA